LPLTVLEVGFAPLMTERNSKQAINHFVDFTDMVTDNERMSYANLPFLNLRKLLGML